MISPISKVITISKDSKLVCLGCLKTKRFYYSFDSKFRPLNLDINYYLGEIDYELEWEDKEIRVIEKMITNFVNELNIKPLNNYNSKSSRFYDRYLLYKNIK